MNRKKNLVIRYLNGRIYKKNQFRNVIITPYITTKMNVTSRSVHKAENGGNFVHSLFSYDYF